jgi:hypothetical protein
MKKGLQPREKKGENDYCFIRRLNIIVIIGKIKYEVKC